MEDYKYGRSLHLLSDRRVPFLGQPAALPVLPGFVPDSPVRGSAGVSIPRGETSEPRRTRGLGPARAAATAEVVRPKRSVMWVQRVFLEGDGPQKSKLVTRSSPLFSESGARRPSHGPPPQLHPSAHVVHSQVRVHGSTRSPAVLLLFTVGRVVQRPVVDALRVATSAIDVVIFPLMYLVVSTVV